MVNQMKGGRTCAEISFTIQTSWMGSRRMLQRAASTPSSSPSRQARWGREPSIKKRERGSSPTRQRGAAHTNPKRERGSAGIECERSSTASTATSQPVAAAPNTICDVLASARSKIDRLCAAGFVLSRNDRKIILYGQLLTTLVSARDAANRAARADGELASNAENAPAASNRPQQQELFRGV